MQWLSLEDETVPINPPFSDFFIMWMPVNAVAWNSLTGLDSGLYAGGDRWIYWRVNPSKCGRNLQIDSVAWLNQPLPPTTVWRVEGNHFRAVFLQPQNKIGGLLTQGSVLIGNGTGTAPHPIYRAVWLQAILGMRWLIRRWRSRLIRFCGESAEKALQLGICSSAQTKGELQ